MNQPADELIDKTLHALRDTQPSPAFESRVLAAVQDRAHRRTSTWLRWPLTLLPAAALLVALAIHYYSRPAPPPADVASFQIPPLEALSPVLTVHSKPQRPSLPATAAWGRNASGSILEAMKGRQKPDLYQPDVDKNVRGLKARTINFSAISQLSAADQLAFDDTHAPSMLAPPMPLTDQERLLLRATRPGSPIELAELQPSRESALRAEIEDRERNAILRYAQRMFASLATAESVNPTPLEQPPALAAKEEPSTTPQ